MATQAGIILGTAAYMSPEQAKGLPADHRSDIFSFGVVLYEMLVGRPPFGGETAPDVLASVLAREPDFAALPSDLRPRLIELLRRCLAKPPKQRWQAIGDVRAELEVIRGTSARRLGSPNAGPRCTPLVAPRPAGGRRRARRERAHRRDRVALQTVGAGGGHAIPTLDGRRRGLWHGRATGGCRRTGRPARRVRHAARPVRPDAVGERSAHSVRHGGGHGGPVDPAALFARQSVRRVLHG